MSIIAGIAKGLGVAGIVVGLVLLIAGLVVGLAGLSDGQDCAARENSFTNRCSNEEGEVLEAKMVGGAIAASSGVVLLFLGSLFYFIARGAERHMDRKADRAGSPLPSIED